jgi:hypothetical protein
MSSRIEFKKSNQNLTNLSSQPGMFFRNTEEKSHNIMIENLLKEGLQTLLESITDKKLPAEKRKALKHACQSRLTLLLCQAVIDDDIATTELILDFDPRLLMIEPASEEVTEIESKLTWRKFLTEKPFIMAQKLNRFEMTKTILPYFERLENACKTESEKLNVTKQRVLPALLDEKEQKQQDEKLQQLYFKDYIEPLINMIVVDPYADGQINHATETALETFKKLLLPDNAQSLDNAINIEQLLFAAYKAYDRYFNTFQNWAQRDIYAIKVIGFIQSLISPELAKAYCEGLYHVMVNGRQIGPRGHALILEGEIPFYHTDRVSQSGLGFNYLASLARGKAADGACAASESVNSSILENYFKQKRQSLGNLYDKRITEQSMMIRR